MIVDIFDLADRDGIDADICIIGSGPAGLALALEFEHSFKKVCVLTGGGFDFTAETQDLYEGEQHPDSIDYFGLASCRFRQFGGGSSHWSARCARLSPSDLQKRDWVAYSGWPIEFSELASYYDRSESFFQLSTMGYGQDAGRWLGYPIMPFAADRLQPLYFQIAGKPGVSFERFDPAKVYENRLRQSKNIQVVLHAHVTHLQASVDARYVRNVEVVGLRGSEKTERPLHVRAEKIVLACGGIENPRMLLTANDIMSTGIGNQNDQVGRYFQEHARGPAATVMSDQPLVSSSYLSGHRRRDGHMYKPGIMLAPEIIEKHKILSSGVLIHTEVEKNTGTDALLHAISELRNGEFDELDDDLYKVVTDFDDVAANIYHRLVNGRSAQRPVREIWVETETEQAPNPQSRVVLSDERDELGIPRLEMNLQYLEIDKHTVEVMMRTLGAELAQHGLGRLKLEPWIEDKSVLAADNFSCHHMGTTRMGDDPALSVVDRNCKVHGMENLYVAGSSVFPTSGYVNPTNTLTALAIRLADHLKDQDRLISDSVIGIAKS